MGRCKTYRRPSNLKRSRNRLLIHLHLMIRQSIQQFTSKVNKDITSNTLKNGIMNDSQIGVFFYTSTPLKPHIACQECRKKCKWKHSQFDTDTGIWHGPRTGCTEYLFFHTTLQYDKISVPFYLSTCTFCKCECLKITHNDGGSKNEMGFSQRSKPDFWLKNIYIIRVSSQK